jgi:hypothetical protein
MPPVIAMREEEHAVERHRSSVCDVDLSKAWLATGRVTDREDDITPTTVRKLVAAKSLSESVQVTSISPELHPSTVSAIRGI